MVGFSGCLCLLFCYSVEAFWFKGILDFQKSKHYYLFIMVQVVCVARVWVSKLIIFIALPFFFTKIS